MTLLDSSRSFSVTETSVSAAPGDTITLEYTGAATGANEYISVILADSGGAATHYGRVMQPADADGSVDVTIPADIAGGSYTLKVFNEQYNGGDADDTKQTDYASNFADIALTVG